MTNSSKKGDFDPEKDKSVKNGPLKPEHKNQYGEKRDDKNPVRAEKVKNKKDKD